MAATLRLCMLVEVTARHRHVWHQTTLPHTVQPILAHLQAAIGVELALVLFGAHAPHSLAAVESSLGWCRDVGHFRRLLLDGSSGLECGGGGGGQPVALAEALLEAAALFALPGGGSTCQQHCLVCLASEPAVHPVAWPFFQDCAMAKLPGLATSAELCHALRRQGIQLGLAGGNLFSSSYILWHLANILSHTPLSLAESRLSHLRQHGEALMQRLLRTAVTLPGGGGMVVLPSWPEALEVLQKGGAKLLPPAVLLGSGRSSGGEGPVQPSAASLPMSAAAAALGSDPATATSAGCEPSPAIQPPTWTPPLAAQGTPPLDAAVDASPGSFWQVLNAEILLSPEGAAPSAGAGGRATAAAAAAAMPPPAQATSQQAAPPQQTPAVQGLPTPPAPPLQPLQRWPTPDEDEGVPTSALSSAGSAGSAGGGSKYALIHTADLLVGAHLTNGAARVLGRAEVLAMPQHAPALQALTWPAELRLVRTMSIASASAYLAGRPNWPTRLKLQQYASQEAQACLTRMLDSGVVGVVNLHNGTAGMLRPARHPATRELLLQLVVVPTALARSR